MAKRLPKFVRCGDMFIAIKTIQYVCTRPEFLMIKYTNGTIIEITQDDANELKQALKDNLDFIYRSNVIMAKSQIRLLVKRDDHVLIVYLDDSTGKLTPGPGVTVDEYFAKLMEELNA